jgi:putative FmdB family regulatory protein
MPIYEYKCQQCGAHFEKRQSVSDEPLTTCEKCHGRLEKQWSLSGFQFKGAGWYVTDYAGKKAIGGESSTKSSVAESTSGGDSASKSSTESSSTGKETPAKSGTE